jgi:hypothetical protein
MHFSTHNARRQQIQCFFAADDDRRRRAQTNQGRRASDSRTAGPLSVAHQHPRISKMARNARLEYGTAGRVRNTVESSHQDTGCAAVANSDRGLEKVDEFEPWAFRRHRWSLLSRPPWAQHLRDRSDQLADVPH